MRAQNLKYVEFIRKAIVKAIRAVPATSWTDPIVAYMTYVVKHGRTPDMRRPTLFNERLLKIKIDGTLREPLRRLLTDKEYVKTYVSEVVGNEYNLETYEILRSEAEVERSTFSSIPCIIKPTHMSGRVMFRLDRETTVDRRRLKRWLRSDYYRISHEINYKFLERKIIVEEFFSEDGRTLPHDFKVFCFFGRPRIIQVDRDRFNNHTRNYYDTAWNRLAITVTHPAGRDADQRPCILDRMMDLASALSAPFSFVRVDMYVIDNQIRVGELTHCHENAGGHVRPAQAERLLGALFERHPRVREWPTM